MARDWRRLALAALAAAAVAASGALGVHAQSAPKAGKGAPAANKAPDKAPAKADDDEEEELKPKAPAKAKKQDPAEAQRAVEAAGKMLEAGKADQAAQSMATVLAGGNLPPAIMAKAFLYRGMAYRQQQKSAQAISDLTSALWLKGGLSQTDRTTALQQRAAAYAEAGLTESGQPLVAAVPQTNTAAKERPTTAGSWGAATTAGNATAASETSATTQTTGSGSGWSLFGGWFGGGSSAQANPASQTQTQQQTVQSFTTTTTVTAAKAVPEPKASSWASGTEVRSEPRPIETGALRARPEGRFRVQLAMVRSQDEAEAVAAKVRRDYAMVLAAREPEIDQAVVGNMGSFYRVRVGPFATQNEGQAACTKLKGSGLDCQVVMQ